jgi:hypothetical protein
MASYYEVAGDAVFRVCPESTKIVELLFEEFGGDDIKIECGGGDRTRAVTVNGGADMSNKEARRLTELLTGLSPYVDQPSYFVTRGDDGEGFLYIGPPEREGEAKSKHAMNQIMPHLAALTGDDREKLRSHIGPDPAVECLFRLQQMIRGTHPDFKGGVTFLDILNAVEGAISLLCTAKPPSVRDAAEVVERMAVSVQMWADHHEASASKNDDPSGEYQDAGNADAYRHVVGGLTTVALKLKDGNVDAALADAKNFGDECPEDDEDEDEDEDEDDDDGEEEEDEEGDDDEE